MSWTDQEASVIRDHWGKGKSASEIAKMLPGRTRSAVIGKASRMGLAKPRMIADPATGLKAKVIPATADNCGSPKVFISQPAPPREPDPIEALTTLGSVGYHQCRWPMGEPALGADMPMCGRRTDETASYCPHHAKRGTTKYVRKGLRFDHKSKIWG